MGGRGGAQAVVRGARPPGLPIPTALAPGPLLVPGSMALHQDFDEGRGQEGLKSTNV